MWLFRAELCCERYQIGKIYLCILFISFISFWLRWLFLAACVLSPVAASGGYSWLRCVGFSLLAVRGLLIAVASLVAEHGL